MTRTACSVFGILTTVCVAGFAGAAEPAPDAKLASLTAGNTAFALDLYAQLRGEEGNVFVSPFSVSTALGMVYALSLIHI